MPNLVNSRKTGKPVPDKPDGRLLAVTSLLTALMCIGLFVISIHRIKSLHQISFPVCLISETPVYRTINSLCGILPAVAVILAVLALIRCRGANARSGIKVVALIGLIVSLSSFAVYFAALVRLASEQLY